MVVVLLLLLLVLVLVVVAVKMMTMAVIVVMSVMMAMMVIVVGKVEASVAVLAAVFLEMPRSSRYSLQTRHVDSQHEIQIQDAGHQFCHTACLR